MTILWHKQARQDLKQALVYCRRKFGRDAAEQFADNIKQQVQLLSTQPYIGQKEDLLPVAETEIRRLVVHKYYKLLYWIDAAEENIVITSLWHTRQNPGRLSEVLASRR